MPIIFYTCFTSLDKSVAVLSNELLKQIIPTWVKYLMKYFLLQEKNSYLQGKQWFKIKQMNWECSLWNKFVQLL